MLAIYKKKFEEIMLTTKGKKKTMLLASLMSQMEQQYRLSMVQAIFERETAPEVQELYLAISNARKF